MKREQERNGKNEEKLQRKCEIDRRRIREQIRSRSGNRHFNSISFQLTTKDRCKWDGLVAVAVKANGFGGDGNNFAGSCADLPTSYHCQHLIKHGGSIVDQRIRFGPWRQTSVGAISAVSKNLADKVQPGSGGGGSGQAPAETIYY